ncbi:MAG: hypothetical protein WC593_06695 [Methanoregula sp.]
MKTQPVWISIICIFCILTCGCIDSSRYSPDITTTITPNIEVAHSQQSISLELNSTVHNSQVNPDEKWIMIDKIGDHPRGEIFDITGSTNLAEGDELLIEVYLASYVKGGPLAYDDSRISGISRTIKVEKGLSGNVNRWHINANTSLSKWRAEKHIVNVNAIYSNASAHTSFVLT